LVGRGAGGRDLLGRRVFLVGIAGFTERGSGVAA